MPTRLTPTQRYLQKLDSTLERMSPTLPPSRKVQCKPFFGGAAAYVDGRIFMTLTTAGLALKLPEDLRGELLRAGGKPLRYFANGHVKKGYVVLPDALLRKHARPADWVARSIAHVADAGGIPLT